MMRFVLFVVTNLAVLLVISVVLRVLGIESIHTPNGTLDYGQLLIFSAVIGMTGSLISLLLSKTMAKMATRAKVIAEPGANELESWLLRTVSQHAQASGIGMPEVAIFESDAPNAFATGARRNAALVAVSTGLLQRMQREEVEAVLGHEVSHVANGDMVTLALIQGVLNTFVIFLSRVVGTVVDSMLRRGSEDRGRGGIGFFLSTIVAQILLGILASFVVAWFSRRREFRADAGGARLAGTPAMIAALERLKGPDTAPLPQSLHAFGIRDGSPLLRLMATHPPLEARIAALRAGGA